MSGMRLAAIVDDLYAGTLEPAAWNRGILSLADLFRSSGVMLFAFNPSTGTVLRSENHRIDSQIVSDYNGYWVGEDIRLSYALKLPVWQPATEITMGVPLPRTRCEDYLLKVDMPFFMPAWLHKTRQKAVALTFEGSLKRGPFGPRDIELFRRVLPHLTRTLEIRDRLEAAEVRSTNLANILDTAAFGVMILDARHRIIEANALASALLQDRSGICRDQDGALRLSGSNGERVSRWLQAAGSAAAAAEALLHIPREGRLPLSALGVPIPQSKTLWMSGDPAWILLLFDGERRLQTNDKVVAKDLGLSEREAAVTALLAVGLDVVQISKRLGVSVNTVRTQIKSAFQKTGCHSQADLVRRVLLGPSIEPVLPMTGR